jgi:hypothetical protein
MIIQDVIDDVRKGALLLRDGAAILGAHIRDSDPGIIVAWADKLDAYAARIEEEVARWVEPL